VRLILEIIKAALFFGSIALVLIALLDPFSDSAKPQRVDQDFLAIGNAIKKYVADTEQPPTTAQGLDALIHKPRLSPRPKRWVTLLAPRETEWRFELRSAGPDRVFGNRDDLASEEETVDLRVFQEGNAESRPSY
jgi:general secretion pathway protein G